jgi:TRAP-type C4-dicarboxylate transport system permease small subunit
VAKLTAEEWRAGFRRLLIVLVALVAAICALAIGLVAFNNSQWAPAFSVATALAAVPLLLSGAGSHIRGNARLRRDARMKSPEELRVERRQNDALSAGLLALGALLFVISVSLG